MLLCKCHVFNMKFKPVRGHMSSLFMEKYGGTLVLAKKIPVLYKKKTTCKS